MKTTALALILLLILAGTSSGEVSAVKIASGKAPTIDGCLAPEEWEAALHVDLAPDGEAWLLQDDEALYVGVRAGQNCIPSLALVQGEKIRVLHASASLGTAVYERSGDGWQATRKFTWSCRDGRTTDEDRERFLADEGWFATTCGVGTRGEAEYRIERSLLTEQPPKLSVVVCRLQPGRPTACAWPATVRDGTRDQDLLFGKTPDLSFEPETWAQLDLGSAGTPAERFAKALDQVESTAAEDPVAAWQALLDLLDEHGDLEEGRDRAIQLRRRLEKQKPVAREVTAQRKLDSALKIARKKLSEVTAKYPGTRAARLAAAQLAALPPAP